MIVLVAMAVVLASVPLCGGKLSALSETRIRGTWLILLGFVIQTLVISVAPRTLEPIAGAVHIASYLLAAVFILVNLRIPGAWIVGLGGGLNFAAIAANGGTMPAGEWATRIAGLPPVDGFTNSAVVADPKLLVFGDIFPIPESWPLSNVFSIGDVLLVIGAAVVLHRLSGSRLGVALAAHRIALGTSRISSGSPTQRPTARPTGAGRDEPQVSRPGISGGADPDLS